MEGDPSIDDAALQPEGSQLSSAQFSHMAVANSFPVRVQVRIRVLHWKRENNF